jgi:hypothetical protein
MKRTIEELRYTHEENLRKIMQKDDDIRALNQ